LVSVSKSSGYAFYDMERSDLPQLWSLRINDSGEFLIYDVTNAKNTLKISPNSGDANISGSLTVYGGGAKEGRVNVGGGYRWFGGLSRNGNYSWCLGDDPSENFEISKYDHASDTWDFGIIEITTAGQVNIKHNLKVGGTLYTDIGVLRAVQDSQMRICGGDNFSFVSDGIHGSGIRLWGRDSGSGHVEIYAFNGLQSDGTTSVTGDIIFNKVDENGAVTELARISKDGNLDVGGDYIKNKRAFFQELVGAYNRTVVSFNAWFNGSAWQHPDSSKWAIMQYFNADDNKVQWFFKDVPGGGNWVEVASIDKDGNLNVGGDLRVNGNAIKDSDGTTRILLGGTVVIYNNIDLQGFARIRGNKLLWTTSNTGADQDIHVMAKTIDGYSFRLVPGDNYGNDASNYGHIGDVNRYWFYVAANYVAYKNLSGFSCALELSDMPVKPKFLSAAEAANFLRHEVTKERRHIPALKRCKKCGKTYHPTVEKCNCGGELELGLKCICGKWVRDENEICPEHREQWEDRYFFRAGDVIEALGIVMLNVLERLEKLERRVGV